MIVARKINKVFYILLICATISLAQERPDSAGTDADDSFNGKNPVTEAAIRQIMNQWKNGYNNGEAQKIAALYSEDAYYLTQHFITGIVYGRPAIQAYFKIGVDAKYKIDAINLLSLGCADDFAYAITRYESTNDGQKAFGVNIVILRKMEDKWLIVAHESAVPDPATAIKNLDISKSEKRN